jgi:MFS family permease
MRAARARSRYRSWRRFIYTVTRRRRLGAHTVGVEHVGRGTNLVKIPRSWWIAASLFVILIVTFGTIANTVGVFVPELSRQFGWSRGRVSLLTSTISLASAALAFPVGWMLDRVEARAVIVAGVVAGVAGYILASRAQDFQQLVLAHVLLGVCANAAGMGPATLVVANWFEVGQGTALAVTVSGSSVGGLVMNLLASRVITRWGWRAGYFALAMPMLVVAAPLALLIVRTRPPSASTKQKNLSVRESRNLLPGLELDAALRSRSFWFLVLAAFGWAFSTNVTETHTIPFLVESGYKLNAAALAWSLLFPSVIAGKLVLYGLPTVGANAVFESHAEPSPDADTPSRAAKESLLPPPLVRRPAEGPFGPLLFSPQPTLEYGLTGSAGGWRWAPDYSSRPRAFWCSCTWRTIARC